MFVQPTRLRTLGAVTLGTLALGACTDPVADTDLRPEGPPEILAVLVLTDAADALSGLVAVETAAYCKPNDVKRPGKVGVPFLGLAPVICPVDGSEPAPLTDAFPDGWYVRIMFDELLDPSVETLDVIKDAMGNDTDNFTGSLAETQPVTLKCHGASATGVLTPELFDVPYDGYYSPSGNNVTWPVGPSLVIQPLDPSTVPVGSECEITVKDSVHDKDGISVPADQRVARKFKIAPVSFVSEFQGPVDGDTVDPIAGGVDMTFNVEIDPSTTLCADNGADPACFALIGKAPTPNPDNVFADASSAHGVFVGADLLDGQTYTFKMPETLKIKDKCGIESTVPNTAPPMEFKTNPMKLVSLNPGGGTAVAPSKKIVVTFNQFMDLSTFVEGVDYTLVPHPANMTISNLGNAFRFNGNYDFGTRYVLTIKAGAAIKDVFGSKDLTFSADAVTDYTTVGKDKFAITAQSPAENARITKAPAAAAPVRLTFNQDIAAASLLPDEFTLTKADGTATGVTPVVSASGAVLTVSSAALPAGSYTFTLKAGATLEDKIVPPNVYTQAADRVIHFTVADTAPPGPAFKCLGL